MTEIQSSARLYVMGVGAVSRAAWLWLRNHLKPFIHFAATAATAGTLFPLEAQDRDPGAAARSHGEEQPGKLLRQGKEQSQGVFLGAQNMGQVSRPEREGISEARKG